jgi:hypothetical protein
MNPCMQIFETMLDAESIETIHTQVNESIEKIMEIRISQSKQNIEELLEELMQS